LLTTSTIAITKITTATQRSAAITALFAAIDNYGIWYI